MYYLLTARLAHARALMVIISRIYDVDEHGCLCLPKRQVAAFWTESKSSARDIARAAVELQDATAYRFARDGSRVDVPFLVNASASRMALSFEFTAEGLDILKYVHEALFVYGGYQLNDFRAFSSRYSLNALLCSLYAERSAKPQEYLPYQDVSACLGTENMYKNNKGFSHYVIEPAFNDLANMATHPLRHKPFIGINPVSNRTLAMGIDMSHLRSQSACAV
ncbi:hypothetical protein AB4254_10860 [Vibrio breoganii]